MEAADEAQSTLISDWCFESRLCVIILFFPIWEPFSLWLAAQRVRVLTRCSGLNRAVAFGITNGIYQIAFSDNEDQSL